MSNRLFKLFVVEFTRNPRFVGHYLVPFCTRLNSLLSMTTNNPWLRCRRRVRKACLLAHDNQFCSRQPLHCATPLRRESAAQIHWKLFRYSPHLERPTPSKCMEHPVAWATGIVRGNILHKSARNHLPPEWKEFGSSLFVRYRHASCRMAIEIRSLGVLIETG
jgi:hypothetical protein